jgi:hypothetical protein
MECGQRRQSDRRLVTAWISVQADKKSYRVDVRERGREEMLKIVEKCGRNVEEM